MRRVTRFLILIAAFALPAAELSAGTQPSVGPAQEWQQQLTIARQAKGANDWSTVNAAYERALTVAQEHFGTEDARLVRTLEEISRAWMRQWDKVRALQAQELAVELRRAMPERQSPTTSTAEAIYALGKIHQRFGEPELAEAWFREALELREGELGTDHRAVSAVVSALSAVIAEVRPDDGEAETLLKRNVSIEQTPQNHAKVADYYADRDQHDLAIEQLHAAIELEEGRPMPRLSELVSLWSRLGDQLQAAELSDEAETALLTALELREEHLGPEHPYLAFTLRKVAELYVAAERFVEAEGHLMRAEGLNRAAWGETNHKCGCNTTSLLEQVNIALGRREAPVEAIEAGEPGREAEDVKDPQLAEIEALDEKAQELRKGGEIEAALETAREALALRQQLDGADSMSVAYGLGRLAMLLRDQRHYDEAIQVWGERMNLLEAHLDGGDSQVLSAMGTMGLFTRMNQDFVAADLNYRRELEGRDAIGQNLKAARILESLGNLNLSRPDVVRAEADFSRAAARWETMAGSQAPEIIRIRALQARAMIDQGRHADAEGLLVELLDREQAKRYPDNHLLVQVLQPLKSVFQETGRPEAANAIESRLAELRELRRAIHGKDERVVRAAQAAGQQVDRKAKPSRKAQQ